MTDAEIIKVNECKTLAEGEKIKAIYPHIVVGGQTEKPCYSIQWYDIEKKTMLDGYASYKLEFVKKWLQENFEEIEFDVGDLINRQKAEIERLKEQVNLWQEEAGSVGCENEWLKASLKNAKAEATKELADKIESRLANNTDISNVQYQSIIFDISEACKEMVGDTE